VSDLRQLLGSAALRLSVAGIESPRLDARLLLAHALGVRPDALVGSIDISDEVLAHFEGFIARRILREPVAYITGKREFWSLEFEVGPGVLIPRPETETLIEKVIDRFPDRSALLEVVDLGTGTGCLLAACLSEYPNARGVGIDASGAALAWARRNIERLGLRNRCRLDVVSWDSAAASKADVILSNPPYIRSQDIPFLAPDVRLYEPVSALDGGEDGLDAYRALAPVIEGLLKPKGLAFLEIGAGQDEAVSAILRAEGLGTVKIATDLAGIGRCVIAERSVRDRTQDEKTVGTTPRNR
jgi:release factor glutamine methyltransferase